MLRARKAEQKEERRAAILIAAGALLAEKPLEEVTIQEVAKRARLSKASVFNYFPTREALFLSELVDQLFEFFEDLNARLDSAKRLDPARLARLLTDTVLRHGAMTQLLSVLHTVLEQNLPEESVFEFKLVLRTNLGQTGALIQERAPFVKDGAQLLLRLHGIVIGLHQMAHPGPVVRALTQRPELRIFNLDFAEELHAMLLLVLKGMNA